MSANSLGSVFVAALVCAATVPRKAKAAVACFIESDYPEVVKLTRTSAGFDATLGVRFVPDGGKRVARWSGGRWKTTIRTCPGDNLTCQPRGGFCCEPARGCRIHAPKHLSRKERLSLRPELAGFSLDSENEVVSACLVDGTVTWFGLGFYEGEGQYGVGGVGRSDAATSSYELRRPPIVRDSTVTALAIFDGALWVGTETQHECLGPTVTHGLVRYSWEADTSTPVRDGPCGALVRDLLVVNGALWVATEMGLSRFEPGQGWSHFAPSGPNGMMQATTCAAQYAGMMSRHPGEIQNDDTQTQIEDAAREVVPETFAELCARGTFHERVCNTRGTR